MYGGSEDKGHMRRGWAREMEVGRDWALII